MDEVGNSISQKGDGVVGGEKCVSAKGTNPKETANTKEKKIDSHQTYCIDWQTHHVYCNFHR